MLKLSMNILIFPMVNTFSCCHFWPSIQTRLSLFFCKKKNVFSEWWNRRFRGSRDKFFFRCPTMVDRLLYWFFSKLFPWILQFHSGASAILLKIKRLFSKFVSITNRFSQNLREEIRNCKQEQYTIKLFAKQITCLNRLPLRLWIFEVEESNQFMLPK